MPTHKQALGHWGEQLATDFLQNKGYTILGRNLHNEHGEIDLLAQHGDTLVFVEVKARSSSLFGLPEEAITAVKRRHLLDSALGWLEANPDFKGDWRIDVISIRRLPKTQPEIVHFENAVND